MYLTVNAPVSPSVSVPSASKRSRAPFTYTAGAGLVSAPSPQRISKHELAPERAAQAGVAPTRAQSLSTSELGNPGRAGAPPSSLGRES